MNSNSHSLPGRRFVCEMPHKYKVNDRVRGVNPEYTMYGSEGVIHALIPFTFASPAYDVLWDGTGKTMVASERGLGDVDVQDDDAG